MLRNAELRQNEDDNVFIKKAQIISAEISRYFSSDIQISYNTRKRINPQMRSPLCMVLENFNEKGFCKYYHEATNMEYLYDPTTKLCFHFLQMKEMRVCWKYMVLVHGLLI